MKNKRFISGAQCPSCKEIDKIYTYEDGGEKFRACSRCDFLEPLQFASATAEIGTRVNRSAEEREQEVQAVRLMDPGGDGAK